MKDFFSNQKQTDIVELILQDHRPLKDLIKILKNAKGDAVERFTAFEKFAPLLLSHAKPEEDSLYDFLKKDDQHIIEGMEGDTEHALAIQLVSEIYDTSDENLWSAKVKVLAEMVEHHIKEEEGSVLPEFKKNATQNERASLGDKYLEIKNQMIVINGINPEHDAYESFQTH